MISRGIEAFREERERQVEEEGYTAEHDAQHGFEPILRAAACYADHAANQAEGVEADEPHPFWPEGWEWKPGDNPFRTMEKAGAMLAAAYDELWRYSLGEDI